MGMPARTAGVPVPAASATTEPGWPSRWCRSVHDRLHVARRRCRHGWRRPAPGWRALRALALARLPHLRREIGATGTGGVTAPGRVWRTVRYVLPRRAAPRRRRPIPHAGAAHGPRRAGDHAARHSGSRCAVAAWPRLGAGPDAAHRPMTVGTAPRASAARRPHVLLQLRVTRPSTRPADRAVPRAGGRSSAGTLGGDRGSGGGGGGGGSSNNRRSAVPACRRCDVSCVYRCRSRPSCAHRPGSARLRRP